MRLHVLTGPSKGAVAEIAGERFVVGRDEACDLVLRDASVARRHASFDRVSRQTYVLRDLGSATGTFVRGKPLEAPLALVGNERLTFGSVTAQLVLEPKELRRRGSRRSRWAVPALVVCLFALAAAAVGAVLATRGGGGGEESFFEAVTASTEAAPAAATTVPPATEEPPAATEETPAGTEGGGEAAAPPPAPAAVEGPGVIAYAHGEDGATEVRVVNPDGAGQGRLAGGSDPAVSPDGRQVALVDPEGALELVPASGGKARVLARSTASGGRALDPDWSPDGSRLVLGDSNGGIEIVGADGTQPRSLGSGAAESPSWSPDGTAIALAARVADDSAVVGTVGADGSDPSPLATVEPLARAAGVDWSPDGTRLVLTCATEDPDGRVRPDVCVMDAGGGKLTAIAGSAGSDADPVWSPDGSRIAFVSDRDGNDEIYVMDADGRGQRRLTFDPAPDREPSWGPGRALSASLAPILFVDDFASPESGWEAFAGVRGGSAAYASGALRLRMSEPGFAVTSDSGRGWDAPVAVRVDAASVGPATNAAFGVVCGYRDQRNLTLLGITADGGFGITRWVDGTEEVLATGGPTLGSGRVPVGAARYRLEVRCGPRRLVLSVNGREVAQAAGTAAGGTVGLFVRTLDRGGADVRFDDLVVSRG